MFDKDNYCRHLWINFPDCIIHADEKRVREHASYHDAKTGDSDAAFELVRAFLNDQCLSQIQQLENKA
jgi:hypothetical protein